MRGSKGEPLQRSGSRGMETKYLDMEGNLVDPQHASKKIVSIFDEQGNVVRMKLEFSKNGFHGP